MKIVVLSRGQFADVFAKMRPDARVVLPIAATNVYDTAQAVLTLVAEENIEVIQVDPNEEMTLAKFAEVSGMKGQSIAWWIERHGRFETQHVPEHHQV